MPSAMTLPCGTEPPLIPYGSCQVALTLGSFSQDPILVVLDQSGILIGLVRLEDSSVRVKPDALPFDHPEGFQAPKVPYSEGNLQLYPPPSFAPSQPPFLVYTTPDGLFIDTWLLSDFITLPENQTDATVA